MIMVRNEKGFTLIESLCAVVITSMTILIASGLWQACIAQERQSAMYFAVSRQAVSDMERLRAEQSVMPGEEVRDLEVDGMRILSHRTIVQEADLFQVTLTFTWQEGGRTHEQTWATLHR
ncbi:hypothetical protein CIG75_08185 [Tumebacillus algifaecis]|uniref:Prepilin-type cleavage/methylation domain-containing protein n=1 Tax=Tumebacillus algifaecis TaxID=1214604 RepID=A0A223D0X8_9BACL|nr:prepilin-type N-terminal cleavage/methylation domain-containing protein [Tumebacillus algifaecis]ASS74966.1 hypothetical protein CIG75_08185 [Tumebacillus algifaecis]